MIFLYHSSFGEENYCFNYALNLHVGAAGVAVAGIMSTVSAMTGAIPAGCSNAYSALAGVCFGEEDRESLIDYYNNAGVNTLIMKF